MKKIAVLPLLLASCLPGTLLAAWNIQPSVEGQVSYDDNIRLIDSDVPGDQDAILTGVTGQVRLARETQTNELSVIAGANYTRYDEYDGPGELESEDNYFGAVFARRQQERSELGLNASVRSDESLRDIRGIEEPVGSDPGSLPSPGDLNDPDSGTIPVQTRRTRLNVNPFYGRTLSERTEVRLNGLYSLLKNDDVNGLDFEDSQEYGGSVRIRRTLSERSALLTQIGWRRFDPDESDDTDIADVLFGLEYQFTPRFNLLMEAGANYSDSDSGGDDQGWLARLEGQRDFERGFVRGELSHELVPNSFGRLIEVDRASLLYRTDFGERWSADLRGIASTTENRDAANTFDNRDYYEAEGELRWLASRTLSVAASYRYRYIDRETEVGGSASGNVFMISIAYRPPGS